MHDGLFLRSDKIVSGQGPAFDQDQSKPQILYYTEMHSKQLIDGWTYVRQYLDFWLSIYCLTYVLLQGDKIVYAKRINVKLCPDFVLNNLDDFKEKLGTEMSQKLAQRLNIGQFEDKSWAMRSKLRQILDWDIFKTY